MSVKENPWRSYSEALKEAIDTGHVNRDEVFTGFAKELFQLQWEQGGLSKLLPGDGSFPMEGDWRQIPPLPQLAFKTHHVGPVFPDLEPQAIFCTSGTTSDVRGVHQIYDLEWYRTISTMGMREALYPPWTERHGQILALLSPVDENPASSLSQMAQFAMEEFPDGAHLWGVRDNEIRFQDCLEWFRRASQGTEPVLVMGTAFAWVHLLEAMKLHGETVALPSGSRIMETGGFKGRSREVASDELHEWMVEALGVPAGHIVNEYGMTELMSQLYSSVDSPVPGRLYPPPWVRMVAVDPETRSAVSPGELGVLCFVDLANLFSTVALQTLDLGRVYEDGSITLQGRAGTVSPRGCSLPWEEGLPAPEPDQAPHPGVAEGERWMKQLNSSSPFPKNWTVGDLCTVLDTIGQEVLEGLTPGGLFSQELSDIATDLRVSEKTLMEGLKTGFRHWNREAFQGVVEEELRLKPESSLPSHDGAPVLVIAASTVPSAMVFDIFAAWLSGRPVLVKVPHSMNRFSRVLRRIITGVAPECSSALYFGTWPGTLGMGLDRLVGRAHSIVVNGSDETVSGIRTEVCSRIPVIEHGSRQSIAILSWEVLRNPSARDHAFKELARDVLLWNQRGCLSPTHLYVEIPDGVDGHGICVELDEKISLLREEWGDSSTSIESKVQWMDLRDKDRLCRERPGHSYENLWMEAEWNRMTVLSEGGKFIVHVSLNLPTESWGPFSPALSTIVAPASLHSASWIQELLVSSGASRLVVPGDAQAPRTHWKHDGYPVLTLFVE